MYKTGVCQGVRTNNLIILQALADGARAKGAKPYSVPWISKMLTVGVWASLGAQSDRNRCRRQSLCRGGPESFPLLRLAARISPSTGAPRGLQCTASFRDTGIKLFITLQFFTCSSWLLKAREKKAWKRNEMRQHQPTPSANCESTLSCCPMRNKRRLVYFIP